MYKMVVLYQNKQNKRWRGCSNGAIDVDGGVSNGGGVGWYPIQLLGYPIPAAAPAASQKPSHGDISGTKRYHRSAGVKTPRKNSE